MKKLLSTLLAVTLLFASSTTTAFAAEATSPGDASTSAVLTADAQILSVTVPTSVLIYQDAHGNVFTPDNMQITNNSAGPIQVKNLAINTLNGWTLDPASTDYSHFKVGKKNFSMTINGQDPALGALSFPTPINGSESMHLALSAALSPQKEAINAAQIGEMVVTIDWYSDEPTTPSYPAGYQLATDAEFSGDTNGSFMYIGSNPKVVMPAVIKGVPVTSYANMFMFSAVKGVISTNPNITNMDGMFKYATSSTLELDINTSSVTRMVSTFENCAATTLDLSSFDTTNVTTMFGAFAGSAATIGYAKAQTDVDKFNASFDKPAALTFVVGGTGGSETGGTGTGNTETYKTATDAEFSGFADGEFQYIGTNKYVTVPSTINGIPVTSYRDMFANTTVMGVKSTNPNITDMQGMFRGTTSATLELDLNTSNVTDMSVMFKDSQATTLNLTGFDTSKVTNMSYMFTGSLAQNIDFSSFNTSNVTNMNYMFQDSTVTTLDLSSFNTANVTSMNNMFSNAQAVTLNLSSFNTASVTDMSGMFQNSKAATLDLSSFDISNDFIGDMFTNAAATIGYAKNQTYADKLNLIPNKPATLTFVVK